MYEIPVHIGIKTRINWNLKNIFQDLKCMFKSHIQTKNNKKNPLNSGQKSDKIE